VHLARGFCSGGGKRERLCARDAEAFAAAGNQIAVSPWGEIEGTLRSEGKALPNAAVRLSRMTHLWEGWPFMVQYEDEVKTDDLGHFKFAQVAPGDAWLTHSASGRQMGIGDQSAYVRVESGKTHQVDLGGKGRPVIGQLVEPANSREKVIWVDTYHYSGGTLRIEPYPMWDQPANWFENSWEQRAAKYAKWSATEAGRIHNENLFPIQIDVWPDGTFRAADVPPGKYKLSLSTYEGGKARELLGGLSMIVQVEPVAAEKAAEPQDLGRLTMVDQGAIAGGRCSAGICGEAAGWQRRDQAVGLQGEAGGASILVVGAFRQRRLSRNSSAPGRIGGAAEGKAGGYWHWHGPRSSEMRKTADQAEMNWPLGVMEQGSSKAPTIITSLVWPLSDWSGWEDFGAAAQ
jgi:hypothetical protein